MKLDDALMGVDRLSDKYRSLLTSGDFQTLPITADIAEQAADLRATACRTPDALQIATALAAGCAALAHQ